MYIFSRAALGWTLLRARHNMNRSSCFIKVYEFYARFPDWFSVKVFEFFIMVISVNYLEFSFFSSIISK